MEDSNGDLEQSTINLHRRIIVGDVTAEAELAELLLPELNKHLERKYPSIYDPDLIDTAVADAILNYCRNPYQYQPKTRSLLGYLLMSAEGDLLNYLKSTKVDQNSVDLAEDVELKDSYSEEKIGGAILVEEGNVEDDVFARLSPVLARIQELLPEIRDQKIVSLILHGVRETQEYALVLGIDHLDQKDQQIIVKKHKDRIKKIITRHIDRNEINGEND